MVRQDFHITNKLLTPRRRFSRALATFLILMCISYSRSASSSSSRRALRYRVWRVFRWDMKALLIALGSLQPNSASVINRWAKIAAARLFQTLTTLLFARFSFRLSKSGPSACFLDLVNTCICNGVGTFMGDSSRSSISAASKRTSR